MTKVQKKDYDSLQRLLFIGNSGTGKSSLLARTTEDKFTSAFNSTHGIDFNNKMVQIGDKRIKLQLWDMAVNGVYPNNPRAVFQTEYFRGAMGIFVVYDVTDLHSFEEVATRWIPLITKHASPNVNIVLIGNKCDLEDQRQVPTHVGQQFASEQVMCEDQHWLFFETSAKDSINVNEAVDALAGMVKDLFDSSPSSNQHVDVDFEKKDKQKKGCA